MGKQKFKLSHMIPNAWFFKLKYNITNSNNVPTYHKPPLCFSTTTTTTSPPPPPPSSPPSTTTTQPRQSYHFTRDLPLEDPPPLPSPSPPRKSKSKKSTIARKTTSNPTKTIPNDGFLYKSEHFDIIIDFDECNSNSSHVQSVETPDSFECQLPRIITNTKKITNNNISSESYQEGICRQNDTCKPYPYLGEIEGLLPRVPQLIIANTKKITKEDKLGPTSTSRRFSVSSPGGVRLKINSPKVMGRKQGHNGNYGGRKSVTTKKKSSSSIWESLAVVKTSDDPQKDFRESMVEMILQNNIRTSKDLEELLACYLSLNSDEYHDVIIKVFKQIWVDLSELRPRHYHKMAT